MIDVHTFILKVSIPLQESYEKAKRMKKCVNPKAGLDKVAQHYYLDPNKSAKYDAVRRFYADFLSRHQMFIKRAQIAKTIVRPTEAEKANLTDSSEKKCQSCNATIIGSSCRQCKDTKDHCAVCNLPIKGLGWSCVQCGHGGHWNHIKQHFFEPMQLCPTGCGCQCLNQMSDYLD